MHELSIALSLIDAASEEAQRQEAEQVNAVYLRLGPLSGVVEEALRSAFDLAREGTALAGAELVIEPVPITAFCPACQGPRDVESIQEMRCRECGTLIVEIVTGRELEVTAMEIAQ